MTMDNFSQVKAGERGTVYDGNDSEMSGVSFSQPPSQQHN